ncbi:alkaline phosphatase D family protein [Piscinibacter sp.]|uniref:alkaline phosphatase D family protein n=1 Tax=Piscinibacter sp. TaxID=1903157 RepID=UPI0039E6EBA6
MDRRTLFRHLGRQAAALALARLFGAAQAQPAAPWPVDAGDPFTLGVASGMPRPDSVVIWTRLAPRPHDIGGGLPPLPFSVRWELAEDERFGAGLRRGEFIARPENAHALHVELRGLASARPYFYRFIAGDTVSAVGRTRTAPAEDAPLARLRLALASCQHYEQGWYAAHAEIAARELDFVLFVGDYIYESSNPRHRLRPHEGPVPQTLDAYRARHATYKLDADLRAAHAAHPWILTWDDHEVENDYAADASPSGLDAPAFLRRRAAAYQAYFEHLPVSPSMAPRGAAMRIHDHFRWGRLAELWTLDGRQYRSVQACGNAAAGGRTIGGDCEELADPARTVFGAAQERWLADGLAGSVRPWRLLAQGSQLGASGVAVPGQARRVFSDGWDGYPRARERLLDAIASSTAAGGNALVLGGDVHRHVAAQLRQRPDDPRSPVVAAEFVCTSISSRGLAEARMAAIRAGNPDLLHARGDERGYALLEITARAAHCDLRATPHPAQPGAALHTQASFTVEAGRPEPVRD